MADPDIQNSRPKKPWVLTFFGLLAAGGLVAMPFLAGPPDAEKMPDIVRFIGHFHPLLLHLPIGVFVLIILQELGAIFGRRHHETVANRSLFPLFFGAASAIIAVIAGFLLFQGGEEYAGSALAERHLWGGLIFAVAAVVTFIFKAWTVALAANPAFYRLLLFASVSVMGFASHDGASMTHGENYLTEYAPDPIRSLLGLEPRDKGSESPAQPAKKIEDRIVYADVVAPILERRCVQCHKESKSKGKFRMDTYDLLLKGGKEGGGIEVGDSAKSNIVIRMELPEDDDEHMPPEGKPKVEDQELAIIKWWIDSGADPLKTIKDFVVPAPLLEAIGEIAPSTGIVESETPSESPHAVPAGPDEALVKAVEELSKEFPGALSFESQSSSLLTFTAVSMRGNLDDAAFKKLAPVTSQFVTVDLSATKITDQAVAQLADAVSLRLVRLAETGITDASIDTLLKLPSLESINLYGTKVTDAGVSKLGGMSNLKRLYLWKTAVTPEAVKALREKLPNCEIITGIEA
jgi:uncharacterized membrane protein